MGFHSDKGAICMSTSRSALVVEVMVVVIVLSILTVLVGEVIGTPHSLPSPPPPFSDLGAVTVGDVLMGVPLALLSMG